MCTLLLSVSRNSSIISQSSVNVLAESCEYGFVWTGLTFVITVHVVCGMCENLLECCLFAPGKQPEN